MANEDQALSRPAKRELDHGAPSTSPPRKRKRPGVGSRINRTQIEAANKREQQREEQASHPTGNEASVSDFVKQHYNTVPEYGRDWRRTESNIKGLRSYNNWVKSVLIIKHAPKQSGFKILDVGCGKGGDLQKWRHQNPGLYVGLDPADVSIEQASGRYREMKHKSRGRLFHADFGVKDCFGESLETVKIVKDVGFDKNNDPRWGGGGFDIVSMMFCMHYAFESEEKARIMLKNVAGSLKKGGKFIGVIPNSDLISAKVQEWHKANGTFEVPKEEATADNDEDERPTFVDSDDERPTFADSDDEDRDPEEPSTKKDAAASTETEAGVASFADVVSSPDDSDSKPTNPLEWGNSIYKVQFPTAPPASGIFRPPFGWKYFFFLAEAVDTVPEYVVPWESFRGLAEDFNLELQYRKSFGEMWEDEKDDREFAQLAERMSVQSRNGNLLVEKGEMEAANFYHAFCFYKV